eukprot:7331241-Pyramimonas_sp.AAC.2
MEIGFDNATLRTVSTFVASLPAGRPAMIFGYVPTKNGTLHMTSASRLSPKVHFGATIPYQRLLPHRNYSLCSFS